MSGVTSVATASSARRPRRLAFAVLTSGRRGWNKERLIAHAVNEGLFTLEGDNGFWSEATIMKRMLVQLGVPPNRIWCEDGSGSTKENVQKSLGVLERVRFHPRSVILMAKPLLQRRSFATAKRWFPSDVRVMSYPYTRPQFPATMDQSALEWNGGIALAELELLEDYAKRGDIVPVKIPEVVAVAGDCLRTMVTPRPRWGFPAD